MPTQNPRINVTLKPSLDALVTRTAELTRTSKSQVLRELLEAAEPALQRAVALMEAAAQATGAIKERLAQSMDAGIADAEKAQERILATLDGAKDLVSQAEEIRERRPARRDPRSGRGASAAAPGGGGGARGVSNPPASNRGVKSLPQGAGEAKVRRAKGGR